MTNDKPSAIRVYKNKHDGTTVLEWAPHYGFAINDHMLAHMDPKGAEHVFVKVAQEWAIRALDDIAGCLAWAAVESGHAPKVVPKVVDLDLQAAPKAYSLMSTEDNTTVLKAKFRDAMDSALVRVSPQIRAGYAWLHKAIITASSVDHHKAKDLMSSLLYGAGEGLDKVAVAALKAVTPESHPSFGSEVVGSLAKAIPGFKSMKQECPYEKNEGCSGAGGAYLWNAIVHLNDYHKWTREQIADWLETLDHDLTMHPVGGGE